MNKGVKTLIVLAVAAVVIGVGTSFIKANKGTVKTVTANYSAGIRNIIGNKGINDLTGVTKIADVNNEYFINYTYNTGFQSSIVDEIGYQLSNRIKQVYTMYPNADKLTFIVNAEFTSNNTLVDKPFIQFTTTRSIFSKINWSVYNYSTLLDISSNVKSISNERLIPDIEHTYTIIPEKKVIYIQKHGQD